MREIFAASFAYCCTNCYVENCARHSPFQRSCVYGTSYDSKWALGIDPRIDWLKCITYRRFPVLYLYLWPVVFGKRIFFDYRFIQTSNFPASVCGRLSYQFCIYLTHCLVSVRLFQDRKRRNLGCHKTSKNTLKRSQDDWAELDQPATPAASHSV